MSATVTSSTTPTPSVDTVAERWTPLAVSVQVQIVFVAALIIAWVTKSQALDLLLGGALTNATTVVNYWLGSSSGSKGKDALIAAKTTPAPGTTTTVTTPSPGNPTP